MRIGLTLANIARFPWDAQVEIARVADRLGYATLWIGEAYAWDAFTQLGWFAAATDRINLATGIVNVYSRSPALIAQSAATLDRVSGGRCVLGLGTSGPGVIHGWHGLPFDHAVQRLRETVEIIRLVLDRQRLVYEGKVFRIKGNIKLAVDPVRHRVPIYLATLSPQGLRATGEIADGWLAAFFSPGQYAEVFKPDLQAGIERRSPHCGRLAICIYHSVVVTEDKAAGRDAARPHLALYIGAMGPPQSNFYNRLFQRYGFTEEADRVQRLYLEHRREEAVQAVTDEMVDRVTIVGPATECRERLEEMASLGVDEVAVQLTVPGGEPAEVLETIRALAPAHP